MKDITFSLPISKVDEEQRIVYGIATTETLDKQNEIVDYEASKKAFSKWSGNIREMHRGDSAVGKAIDIQYDDDAKQVMIGAYISKSPDGENAWTKIKEGILTGFSIGGRVFKRVDETAKTDTGDVKAVRIADYELSETSLVDSPANPEAMFAMVKSVDGHLQQVEEMVESPAAMPYWMKSFSYTIDQNNQTLEKANNGGNMEKKDYTKKQRDDMAASGEALPDGSFPIANETDLKNAIKAVGRASDEAAAKKHIEKRAEALGLTDELPDIWKTDQPEMTKADDAATTDETVTEGSETVETTEVAEVPAVDAAEVVADEKADKPEMKKSLYEVGSLAEAIACIACVRDWLQMEKEWEGDDSDIPARLSQALSNLGGILTDMAKEETQEAAASTDVGGEVVELAAQPDMTKAFEAATQKMLDSATEAFGAKVETMVQPLAERLAQLENQPSKSDRPVASFIEVEKGTPAQPSAGDAKAAELEELKKVAETRKYDRSFGVDERRSLVDRMWKLQKEVNHTTTADLNPAIAAQFPDAFTK